LASYVTKNLFAFLMEIHFCIFSEPEPQILTYLTQQHKLFPLLAATYAFHFVQLTMVKMYSNVNEEINQGDFSRSQEVLGSFNRLINQKM